MKTWILLDVSYLCYRAFFTTGRLEWGGDPTGVIYGFLRDLSTFKAQFMGYGEPRLVFCFDHGKLLREELCPGYKESRRRNVDDEQAVAIEGMRNQVEKLKWTYLEQLGYSNIFFQKGYEADDIIASLVKFTIPKGDTTVIVSADKDLYQLLSKRVMMFNPAKQELVTAKYFRQKYGIGPEHWADVKALAGCHSDCIPGIVGVGEKTAIKYIRGELKPTSAAYKRIESAVDTESATRALATNYVLVRLPFDKCKVFQLSKDNPTENSWRDLTEKLGMTTLVDRRG